MNYQKIYNQIVERAQNRNNCRAGATIHLTFRYLN